MTVGDFGDWQRLAHTRVGHDKMVVRLEQGPLIPHARFALTPGQSLVSGRSGRAGSVGPVPGVPPFCRAPRECAPAVASPRSHQRSWLSQGVAAVYTGDGGGLDRPRVDVERSLDVSGTAVAPAPDGLRNGTA